MTHRNRERKAGDRKTTQKAIKAGSSGGGDFAAVCAAESEEGGLVDTKTSTLPRTDGSANGGCVAQTEVGKFSCICFRKNIHSIPLSKRDASGFGSKYTTDRL